MSTTQYINVNRSLQNLKDSDLPSENVDAIQEFINHCAAEGLSDSRQKRHIQSLKKIITKFAPKDFQLRKGCRLLEAARHLIKENGYYTVVIEQEDSEPYWEGENESLRELMEEHEIRA